MRSPQPKKEDKTEIIRNGGFIVRLSQDKTSIRQGYRLTWYRGSQRQRKFCKDKIQAREEARRIAGDLREGRVEAANANVSDLDDLGRARLALAGFKVSLEQVARDWAESSRLLAGRSIPAFIQTQLDRMGKIEDRTLPEVALEFIAEKEARKKGHNYIRTLRRDLLSGAARDIQKPILLVSVEDLEQHLKKWGGRNRNNRINSLVSLFNFAKGRYLPESEKSAAERLEKDRALPSHVEIWKPEEAELILRHAKPDELGFFALSLFGGIRTEELARMDWSHVRPSKNADESHIEITAEVSKMGLGRRVIPILPALAAYLKKIGKPASGRIVPNANMNNRMIPLSRRAGIKWKQNASRHSFASYRLADVKNVHQVAEEMGNSPLVIKKRYFQAVTKAEAAKFWAIRPE